MMGKAGRVLILAVVIAAFICACVEGPLPAGADTASENKYDALLRNRRIAKSIVWAGRSGTQYYQQWPREMKDGLMDAINRIEKDEPFPMQGPPELIENRYISESDAWTIYLAHVAHTLWLEANQMVNWSILSYSDAELQVLLDSRKLFLFEKIDSYSMADALLGDVTDWNIAYSYGFMKRNGYIAENQAKTVYLFAGWVRNNVKHYSHKENETEKTVRNRFWGYEGPPPVDRILSPISGTVGGLSYSAGCWGTTGLFIAVMRSVNIPVVARTVSLGIPGMSLLGFHSAFTLPSLGIGITHGDNFYSMRRYGQEIPTEKIFRTLDWIETFIDNPVQTINISGRQNRKEDQAGYNHSKYLLDLSIEYLTDHLLLSRALCASQKTRPADLIDSLTGMSVNDKLVLFAEPYYPEEEIDLIIRKIDAELVRIGGGDWKKGAAIVRKAGKPIIIDLASGNNTAMYDASLPPAAFKEQLALRSTNGAIASVSDTGLITGLKKGVAVIQAFRPDGTRLKDADRTVIVTFYAGEIVLTGEREVVSGKKVTLKAEVLPAQTVNKGIVWESSDPETAAVSSRGVVTAKKVEEQKSVVITATARDGSGTMAILTITVLPKK